MSCTSTTAWWSFWIFTIAGLGWLYGLLSIAGAIRAVAKSIRHAGAPITTEPERR